MTQKAATREMYLDLLHYTEYIANMTLDTAEDVLREVGRKGEDYLDAIERYETSLPEWFTSHVNVCIGHAIGFNPDLIADHDLQVWTAFAKIATAHYIYNVTKPITADRNEFEILNMRSINF